jgi:CRP/FNR family transcriptional regulator, cyclic AMP receptor protein
LRSTAETLRGIDIFADLGADERRDLAGRCQAHHYEADKLIVSHQDNSTDVYFIVSGKVRATIFSRSGKEVSFRDLGAGQLFGDLSAIDGEPRSASVVALSDAVVVSMPAEVFWQVLRKHPAAAAVMLRELTRLVRRLSERVVEFSTLGVKNRIHAELLRLAREHMQDANKAMITPAPTHSEIASRVSTHREAVTRELNQLAQDGLVARQRGGLAILDVTRLSRLVEDVQSSA